MSFWTVEDAGPYNFVNILMRTSPLAGVFCFVRGAFSLAPYT